MVFFCCYVYNRRLEEALRPWCSVLVDPVPVIGIVEDHFRRGGVNDDSNRLEVSLVSQVVAWKAGQGVMVSEVGILPFS